MNQVNVVQWPGPRKVLLGHTYSGLFRYSDKDRPIPPCLRFKHVQERSGAHAPKSRRSDHLHAAVRGAWELGHVPVVPPWAVDKHTQQRKREGRGVEHWLSEGCHLMNVVGDDPYNVKGVKPLVD